MRITPLFDVAFRLGCHSLSSYEHNHGRRSRHLSGEHLTGTQNHFLPVSPSLGRNRIKISQLLGEYSLSFAAHKTGSAILSREFGHPHEFPCTVFGVKPDDILLRISNERPVGDDCVPLRLTGIQHEARAIFSANDVQDARALVIGPIEPSDLPPVQHRTADMDGAINKTCKTVVRRRKLLIYRRVRVHLDLRHGDGDMIPRGRTETPGSAAVYPDLHTRFTADGYGIRLDRLKAGSGPSLVLRERQPYA